MHYLLLYETASDYMTRRAVVGPDCSNPVPFS
jgi:hypothetical protein